MEELCCEYDEIDYDKITKTEGLTRDQLLILSMQKNKQGCATQIALRAQYQLAHMDNGMYGIGNSCAYEMSYIPYGVNDTYDNR